MRIAHFSDNYLPQVGGVTSSLLNLNGALVKMGHEVHVFTVGAKTKQRTNKGVKEHYYEGVELAPVSNLSSKLTTFHVVPPYLIAINRVFQKKKFDIIHCHTPYSMGLNGLRIARKYKITLVATYHANHEKFITWWTRGNRASEALGDFLKIVLTQYNKWFHNKCDVLITPSNETRRHMKRAGINTPHVVPNGIDLRKFRPSKKTKEFRKKYDLGSEPFVLYLGRISREKNIDFLVRTAGKMKAKLVLCGIGPDEDRLKKYIKKKKIATKIKFLGYLEDREIAACYSAASVFAMPSLCETQGMTVIESMACGTPAVVFDSATAEMVDHGKNGFIAKNSRQFSSYVNKILTHKDLRKRMEKNAALVAKTYSPETFASKVIEVYLSVLKKKQSN